MNANTGTSQSSSGLKKSYIKWPFYCCFMKAFWWVGGQPSYNPSRVSSTKRVLGQFVFCCSSVLSQTIQMQSQQQEQRSANLLKSARQTSSSSSFGISVFKKKHRDGKFFQALFQRSQSLKFVLCSNFQQSKVVEIVLNSSTRLK